MQKKVIKVLLALIAFIIFIIWGANLMAPGSNARAEFYVIDLPRSSFHTQLQKFREYYPQYKLTRKTSDGDLVEYPDKKDHFYIYIPSLKSTLICVITKADTQWGYAVGLKAISEGNNLGGFKGVNTRELSRAENAEIKNVFETEILNKIGQWEYKRNGFMRFVGLY